ncbi:MAG TPA: hypothetical protein DCM62_04135 [Bacteroidales bacterium]|nr:hypothetical protein [Bacteroidales bacterium]
MNSVRFFCFFLCLLSVFSSKASDIQTSATHIRGRVVDLHNGNPIAHAHIMIVNTQSGTISGSDGTFSINYHRPVRRLFITHIGYMQRIIEVAPGTEFLLIELEKQPVELGVVQVRPGINPAHRIIDNAIAAREQNNPKNLPSFTYTAYSRFVVSGRLPPPTDTTNMQAEPDSAQLRLQGFFDRQHLMMTETVSNRKVLYPNRSSETIVANRIAGFQNPEFAVIASQLQSFSIYENQLTLAGQSFVSPLSPAGRPRYNYQLLSAQPQGADTIFTITFSPIYGTTFQSLKGSMQITTQDWAVKHLRAGAAHPQPIVQFSIEQNLQKIDNLRWFPVKIAFDVETHLLNAEPFRLYGRGSTHLQNIVINPPLRARDLGAFQFDFAPNTDRGEDFWLRYRPDTLTTRHKATFAIMDSIGAANHWDRTFSRTQALMTGRLGVGQVDLGILDFLRYNDYRGFIPGLRVFTNNNFSHQVALHGHIAYGMRNQSLTYGLGGSLLLSMRHELWLGYRFDSDFVEPGSSNFLNAPRFLSPDGIRSYIMRSLDRNEGHTAYIHGRTLRHRLWIKAYVSDKTVFSETGYGFVANPLLATPPEKRFRFVETGLQMRFGVGERFFRTPSRIITLDGDGPIIHLNLAHGNSHFAASRNPYRRVELRIEDYFPIPLVGTQYWQVQMGMVSDAAPWHKMFTAPAAFRRFSIAIPNSFATMRFNEFASNEYLMVFFAHDFENLIFGRGQRAPNLLLLTHIAFGRLTNAQAHINAPFREMNRGFFESGFALENILNLGITGMGLEALYRYGAYAFPDFADNISVKLRLSILFSR